MKKKLVFIIFMCVIAAGIFNINLNVDNNNNSTLVLKNLEALAQENHNGNSDPIYQRPAYTDCTVDQIVDGEGYVTLFGKRFKATGIGAGGRYVKTYYNVANECQSGGNYMCTRMTCAMFFLALSSL